MAVYLILARGPDADNATPILASSDPRVIGAALQAIAHLGDQEPEFEYPLMDYPTIVAVGRTTMNHVHEPLPDSTRELAHLWPLVHLVVELAQRHGAAVTLPPADPVERLLPKHDEWGAILERAEATEITGRIGRLGYLAGAMKLRGVEPMPFVADIPVEEIVVLMLIQELALTARADISGALPQRPAVDISGVG